MNFRMIVSAFSLAVACALLSPISSAVASIQLNVLEQDPENGAVIGLGDHLTLRVSYTSGQPLRFRVDAFREGSILEVGAITNPGTLQPSGEGETLVWIGFSNATHIDGVRITAIDAEWRELEALSVATDVTWRADAASPPRTPAAWVTKLQKSERRESDFTYDPLPKPAESLIDIFFLVSLVSLPVYLLLQVQMLRLYRTRWRELAAVPLVSLLPLILFSLIGFGMNLGLWASFLFRCVPFALLYLLVLWVVKRFWSGKLPAR